MQSNIMIRHNRASYRGFILLGLRSLTTGGGCKVDVDLGGVAYKALLGHMESTYGHKFTKTNLDLLKAVLQTMYSEHVIDNIRRNQLAIRPIKMDCNTRIVLVNNPDEPEPDLHLPDFHSDFVRSEYVHRMLPATIISQITWQPDVYYEQSRVNCFAISPLDGFGDCYRLVASHLHAKMFGLNTTCDTPIGDIVDLSNTFTETIVAHQRQGPYVILAHGFGIPVAHKIACNLETNGNCTVHLILVSGPVNSFSWDGIGNTDSIPTEIPAVLPNLAYWASATSQMSKPIVEKELSENSSTDFGEMVNTTAELMRPFVPPLPDLTRSAMTHFFSKLMALSNYEPEDVFGGAVTLTETDEYIIDAKYPIDDFCEGDITVIELDNTKNKLMNIENAKILAAHIDDVIRRLCLEQPVQLGSGPNGKRLREDDDHVPERKRTAIICSICLSGASPPLHSIPCGHVFCKLCIEAALKETKKCPECNQPAEESRRIYLKFVDI